MNFDFIEGLNEEQIQNIMDDYESIFLSGECGCFASGYSSKCKCIDKGSAKVVCNDSPSFYSTSSCQVHCTYMCRDSSCYRFYSPSNNSYQTFCQKNY